MELSGTEKKYIWTDGMCQVKMLLFGAIPTTSILSYCTTLQDMQHELMRAFQRHSSSKLDPISWFLLLGNKSFQPTSLSACLRLNV